MDSPAAAPSPDSQVDARQRLRLRRVLLSVAVYVPCALMLVLVGWLGFLPPWFTWVWAAIFTGANLVFVALIRTGANLGLRDPSMTMGQMAVAMAAVAMILYFADAVRGGMLMLLLVIIVFGVLRLATAQLLVMGGVASLAYAGVIALLAINRPGDVNLRVEWTQWAILTATLAVLGPLVGYMSNTRRRLSESLRTIKDMAQRDALTGVFNRHHMDEMLAREISRCERGAPPFLLLIADIDHFKHINDHHGHLVGDLVLKAVAGAMRESLRKADYLARYGGEEFVLMVAANGAPEARALCERIRAGTERLRIAELGSRAVTIFIGAAFYRQGDTPSALTRRSTVPSTPGAIVLSSMDCPCRAPEARVVVAWPAHA